jgi:hypothetical protein
MAAKIKRKKPVGDHQTVAATSAKSAIASRSTKLSLRALLAQTPEDSVDIAWEKMRPTGSEFR